MWKKVWNIAEKPMNSKLALLILPSLLYSIRDKPLYSIKIKDKYNAININGDLLAEGWYDDYFLTDGNAMIALQKDKKVAVY